MNVTRDRRASRWDTHRATRRAELVDAALAAIREHGAAVGMDDVAARAGTSKTVVYRHFGDRTQLWVAVCARVAEVLVEQVRGAVDGAAHPRDKLAAGIGAYLRLIEHDPEVYRFVVHRPLLDREPGVDPVADLVTVVGEQAGAVIAAQLNREAGGRAVTWGHALVGMVRGAGESWLNGRGSPTRQELADQLGDLVWSGLSAAVLPAAELSTAERTRATDTLKETR